MEPTPTFVADACRHPPVSTVSFHRDELHFPDGAPDEWIHSSDIAYALYSTEEDRLEELLKYSSHFHFDFHEAASATHGNTA